ncbi:FAD:protein FMN transferase [Saccharobesus litoralis]|uniref:FAD:protein FMN transferase n=1 Tax=Saccharobesus litoralis TaxID=2172099 RepID=UPI001E65AC2F|nr:FAD:protein FMN transferase [Saccharobesus litoralis]
MNLNKIQFSFFTLVLLLVSACSDTSNKLTPVELQGRTMGTTYSVKFFATEQQIRTEQFYKDIEALLETVNQQMSTYRPDSEISRFNTSANDEPFIVSSDTAYVVQSAIDIGVQSEGALDITIGPLVNLWGFGPNGHVESAPTSEQIALAKGLIGIDKLLVKGRTLIKTQDQLYIDLSAIAKGFGVDKIAEYLEAKGINRYLAEIGGEMRAKGKKMDGSLWRVAIEKPTSAERAVQQVVDLQDKAIATSGDYRNYFEKEGKRYSHTIDPSNGKPITHKLASVTVIHDSTMMADGYATALNVMGPQKALEFAERQNLAVYLVVKSAEGFDVKYSSGFSSYIQ